MCGDVSKETGGRLIKLWSSGLVLENNAPQFVDVVDKILSLARQFRDEVEANKAEATRDNDVFH